MVRIECIERNNDRNNTWPLIYHGNGESKHSDLFKRVKESNFEEEDWKENNPLDNDITIITWSIPEEKTILEECFEKMGILENLIIIPIEKPFNWLDKIKKTKEYLRYVKTKYVMGLDSTDIVISIDDEGKGRLWEQIIDNFKEFNCKLIYNAEKSNWPSSDGRGTYIEEDGRNGNLIKLLKETEIFEQKLYKDFMKSDFYRLNSGAFIGETDYTKNFYEELWDTFVEHIYNEGFDEGFFGGDQGFIRIMQKRCFPDMVIDYDCVLFQTFAQLKPEEIKIWK